MQIQGSPADPRQPLGQVDKSQAAAAPRGAKAPASLERFQEMAQILKVTPEGAEADLKRLFDFPSSGLTLIPKHKQQVFFDGFAHMSRLPNLPETLDGLAVERTKLKAKDGGPDWTLTRIGTFEQKSREVPCQEGGPPWNEVSDQDDKSHRWRMVGEPEDGRGPWTEIDGEQGRHKTRFQLEEGVGWQETLSEGRRFRHRAGGAQELMNEARQAGSRSCSEGEWTVSLYGQVGDDELDNLQRALAHLPGSARALVGEIYLTSNLGQVTEPDESKPIQIAGMAGARFVILDKTHLATLASTKFVLYHQLGHSLDARSHPPVSSQAPHSGVEEFAEVHRIVLEGWAFFVTLSAQEWWGQPYWQEKVDIVRRYGGEVPGELGG